MLCVSRATPVDPDEYPPLFLPLFQFLHPLFSPAALREIAGMGGFPLRWEESRIAGNRRTQVVKEVVEISKGNLRPERRDPPDYVLKERISYQDLRLASAGPAPPPLGAEEEAIGALLAEFQEGYRKRDPAEVGDWVDRLFSPDASVIGTNSVFPGDFEWRSGRESVMEMISNDWLRWGDLEMYPDDAEISLLGESAWVSMVATVRRDPSQGDRYRWPEDSRRGSLSRIREFTGEALPSVLALYEIIHDASEVLVQYERGAGFLWPIRMTFVLIRTEDGWRIRHMHWSLPGRGFPAVRLFDARSEERPGDL